MADKRAVFDFEITFSNGGGIQGQDFRLDIQGDDISDEALAAHIIADLRLLMVEQAVILNKRIIEEPHKRSAASLDSGAVDQTLVDLSHVIEDGMVTYKGLPAPVLCDHLSRLDFAQGLRAGDGVPDRPHRDGRQYRDLSGHALSPLRRWLRPRGIGARAGC